MQTWVPGYATPKTVKEHLSPEDQRDESIQGQGY